jgi:flavin-dependent dehydrogenase
MDRRPFPRDKVCAGWITPAVVDALRLDLTEYARERVLQPIHSFRIGLLGGGEVETRRRAAPVSYGIRRCEFDHYLLQRSGARLRVGEALREIRRENGSWLVNDELRAKIVVGAGGHFCPVARWLGARPGKQETAVLAQEIEFRLTPRQGEACRVDPAVPQLFFCHDLLGYGWAFRKGEWLNVGLGREDPERLTEHVAAFREFLVSDGRIPSDTPTKFHGHAYVLYSHAPRRVFDDGVLLVGDAAGLAYPESGEGIRPAVESGLLAAKVIDEARGEYRAARLAPYRDLLTERFGSPEGRRTAADFLPGSLRRFLAHRLLSTEWFARTVVMDRWFLHRHQPALAI